MTRTYILTQNEIEQAICDWLKCEPRSIGNKGRLSIFFRSNGVTVKNPVDVQIIEEEELPLAKLMARKL